MQLLYHLLFDSAQNRLIFANLCIRSTSIAFEWVPLRYIGTSCRMDLFEWEQTKKAYRDLGYLSMQASMESISSLDPLLWIWKFN